MGTFPFAIKWSTHNYTISNSNTILGPYKLLSSKSTGYSKQNFPLFILERKNLLCLFSKERIYHNMHTKSAASYYLVIYRQKENKIDNHRHHSISALFLHTIESKNKQTNWVLSTHIASKKIRKIIIQQGRIFDHLILFSTC